MGPGVRHGGRGRRCDGPRAGRGLTYRRWRRTRSSPGLRTLTRRGDRRAGPRRPGPGPGAGARRPRRPGPGARTVRPSSIDRGIDPPPGPAPWAGSGDQRRPPVRYVVPARVAEPVTNRRCRADEPRVRARGGSAGTDPLAHRPHLLRHTQQTRPGARPGSVRGRRVIGACPICCRLRNGRRRRTSGHGRRRRASASAGSGRPGTGGPDPASPAGRSGRRKRECSSVSGSAAAAASLTG
jgi:hypothetical protein